MRRQTPRVGIALSGGTLKAATHAGVLWALEQAGIIPDCIAGTSAGSLVGALFAHGYTGKQLEQIIRQFPGLRLLDYGFPVTSSIAHLLIHKIAGPFSSKIPSLPGGIIRGQKFEKYIQSLLSQRKSKIPLFVVATDLISGRPIIFHSEPDISSKHNTVVMTDLSKTILGSCALPGIFTPVSMGPYQLVDGAFRHYVPVSILREYGCSKIIAINLYRLPQPYQPATIVDVLVRSFEILLRESIDNDLESGNDLYVIEPDLSKIRWRSFSEMKKCLLIGQRIIHNELPNILTFLK